MKTFVIAMLVLAILVFGIFIYSGYIKDFKMDIMKTIERLTETIGEMDWEKSNKEYNIFSDKWNKNEKMLSMFNDHGDLDEIQLAIVELNESIKHTDKEHSLKAIEKIKVLLERLAKNESFSLENILGLAQNKLYCHKML